MQDYDEEEHWWPEDQAYVSNNAFKHSRALTAFSCGRELLELADRYLGKHALITRGVAMRYLPQVSRGHDMFGWHHDIEDRELDLRLSRVLSDTELGQLLGLPAVASIGAETAPDYSCKLDLSGGQEWDAAVAGLLRAILDLGVVPRRLYEGQSLERHFLSVTGNGDEGGDGTD